MIQIQDVFKNYGPVQALRGVSLSVGAGEVVGLLGPNGAGKTTLLRILTGYFEPSGGSVRVGDIDVVEQPLAARTLIGYLPESTALYPEMLVQEYLQTVADLRGIEPRRQRALISDAVYSTELQEHLTRPIGALSKGFRQRVGLAQAILHKPRLLVLDEPTSGLDPTQVGHVRELIQRLSETTTVLFSTHILPEVEQVCDRAVVILGGQVQADARLDELQGGRTVALAVAQDSVEQGESWAAAAAVRDAIEHIEDVAEVRDGAHRDGYVTLEAVGASGGDLARTLFRLARDRGWELGELRPVRRDLEAVFNDLVREHAQGIAATFAGEGQA